MSIKSLAQEVNQNISLAQIEEEVLQIGVTGTPR